MEKKTFEEFKEKLIKEKRELEGQLEKIAKKESVSKEWKTNFPSFNGEVGLEEEADEVEEYENLMAVEQSFETRLKEINLALQKIEKGTYGVCEKCKKAIEIERLKIIPEARFCKKCKK